jgi:hypothetical protein
VSGPIYIAGLDRSGKTTIAAFLTSHPNIAIPEVGSNMWTYFYRRFGDLADQGNLDRCLDSMLRYSHVAMLEPDPERIRRELLEAPPTYARLFELFLRHFAERQGKPRWGAQTGLVERYTSELFAGHPGVQIVHMIRDPRDRYEAAVARSPRGRGGAGGATARWMMSVKLAERGRRRHPARYMVVRFEDLVLRPEETLGEVCRFLGERFVPEMLAMEGAPERRSRLLATSGSSTTDVPLSDRFIGRFRGRVPPRELAFMQLHAGRRMRAHGYEPTPIDLAARDRLRFAAVDWPSQAGRMVAWRALSRLQHRLPATFGPTPDPRTVVDVPIGASR